MTASTPVPLTEKSRELFITYYNQVQNTQNVTRSEMRTRLEGIDLAYQRETDQTQEHKDAKRANAAGDSSKLQNMTVPVVMPQVEAAVTYQTSVFLTGHPLFAVVAAPDFIDEALQLDTIIEENSIRGGWTRELILFFRDGFKYNFAPLEVTWCEEVTAVIETDITKSLDQGIPKEVIWSGNKVKRLDPYNTFIDPRVPPTEVYKKGEFAGYTELMSRIELKCFIASLPDKIVAEIVPAFESGIAVATSSANSDSMSYYVPSINAAVTETDYKNAGTNWLSWAGLSTVRNQNINYKDMYEVTTVYVKVLPSEFELKIPNKNTPQIYKLVIVNHKHIIYCERQTNAHGYLPVFVGQPLEDGLSYQTKSLAENGKPFQEVTTAYLSSIMSSRRRAISDRVLYDPSRIAAAQINSANPSAKIPVRPSAYGGNIAESVYAFPYREDQAASSMQQIQMLLGLANQLSGQNQASQGQFVKGNKTLHEFDSVMQNANGRDQLAAILLEAQVFVPLKHILKVNVLQYQGGTTIYNRDKRVAVEVDPIKLRKAILEFQVADGLVPAAKLLNSDSFAVALQVFGSSPQIASQYNVGHLFSYMMKTQGADIGAFEKSKEQVAYEQALQTWQAMAQLAIEKGMEVETALPPMPQPQEYNYDPAAQSPEQGAI